MRWTFRRKADLIMEIRQAPGATRDELRDKLLAHHGISADEWQSWLQAFDAAGREGLKVTKMVRA